MPNGLDNVAAYQDDKIVFSKDEQSHVEALCKVLIRLTKKNVSISKGKCVFNTNEISYLVYIISNRGIELDNQNSCL